MFDPTKIELTALPSVAFERWRELPDCQGIYFAATPTEVLYIGKAKSINSRWLGHHRKADIAAWEGVSISWLQFDGDADLLDEIERACIEYFNPVLNGGSVEHAATVRCQLVMPVETLEAVRRLADEENRSVSNMLAVLVKEAIKAREDGKLGNSEALDQAA